MQAPRMIRTVLTKHVGRRNYTGPQLPNTTLSDLPSPQGSWKTQFDAKQRKYNAQLIGGVAAVVGSIIIGKAAGFLEFHDDIPKRLADIPSYK